MDLVDLRIFLRVAAVQNLSSVAAELDLTPGTISKRIQTLEEHLSVRLFNRTTRSIRITQEGTQLLEYAERILNEVDNARAAISANTERPKGRLRIAAPASFARQMFVPAISTFMERYEDIDLHVDLTDNVTSLQSDGYDVVLRVGELEDCAIKAKRLASDPQVIVAAPSYLARHGEPEAPEALLQHSCLNVGDASAWTFRRKGEEKTVRVSGRLKSNSNELLRHAACGGHGIVRLSEVHVRDDMRSGNLVRILEDYEMVTNSAVWALYPNTRHVLPRLRVLLDFLADYFRKSSPSPLPFLLHPQMGSPARLDSVGSR